MKIKRLSSEALTMNVIWKKPLVKKTASKRMPKKIQPSIPLSWIISHKKKTEKRPHTPRTMRKIENRTLREE